MMPEYNSGFNAELKNPEDDARLRVGGDPFVHQFLGEEDGLVPNDIMAVSATAMLDERVRVAEALRPLRTSVAP
ncbi:hypothetical protein [Streptomyces camelliae]|uniref:Uncharacterized protein n=1 Tax=Streptomyces camelliae TaxID=3004093 RepID=A0ABY7NVI1_9ACTN|nr:hypothetical protein [Streptomyces sp. HUAS 2-6]WBO61799.1 hypothetical protein O1G22_02530 [Streptomyces sp. HUAS 2-6]